MRKAELEGLLNALMPHAERMLDQYGEFFPFAGALRRDGVREGVSPTAEGSPSLEGLREGLLASLRAGVSEGRYRATGLVLNVEIDVPGQEGPSRAVRVSLEHESGVGYDVFVPYWFEGGQLAFGEAMAEVGRCEVFRECIEASGEVAVSYSAR